MDFILGSSYRSLAYFFQSAWPWVSSSQPVCACHRPLSPLPWPTCGLCGSPSTSVWAWCLRWSATQSRTEPWTLSWPRPAKVRSSHGSTRNDRGVSSRWKPTVTPIAVPRYITAKIARSTPSTQEFHSSTIATRTPTNGTTTPARLARRSVLPMALHDGVNQPLILAVDRRTDLRDLVTGLQRL